MKFPGNVQLSASRTARRGRLGGEPTLAATSVALLPRVKAGEVLLNQPPQAKRDAPGIERLVDRLGVITVDLAVGHGRLAGRVVGKLALLHGHAVRVTGNVHLLPALAADALRRVDLRLALAAVRRAAAARRVAGKLPGVEAIAFTLALACTALPLLTAGLRLPHSALARLPGLRHLLLALSQTLGVLAQRRVALSPGPGKPLTGLLQRLARGPAVTTTQRLRRLPQRLGQFGVDVLKLISQPVEFIRRARHLLVGEVVQHLGKRLARRLEVTLLQALRGLPRTRPLELLRPTLQRLAPRLGVLAGQVLKLALGGIQRGERFLTRQVALRERLNRLVKRLDQFRALVLRKRRVLDCLLAQRLK